MGISAQKAMGTSINFDGRKIFYIAGEIATPMIEKY
jgi:hypothetical protein